MDTRKLVSRFKRIKHQNTQYQRNAIQLSRNHAFEQYGFWGYYWRFHIIPVAVTLSVMGMPWLFWEYSDLGFFVVGLLGALAGYIVDTVLYFTMINSGLDAYLKDPQGMTEIPRKPLLADQIHRCGAPDGWRPKF
jgi:hypothetical protein